MPLLSRSVAGNFWCATMTAGREETADALDAIYDTIDEALLAGRFSDVDSQLAALDVDALSIDVLLGWLTISYAAMTDGRLPAYAILFDATYKRLVREDGEQHALTLLTGLAPRVEVHQPMPCTPEGEALAWAIATRMS